MFTFKCKIRNDCFICFNKSILNFQANNNKLEVVYADEKLKLQNIFEDIKKKEDIIKICRNDLESKSNYNSRFVLRNNFVHKLHVLFLIFIDFSI